MFGKMRSERIGMHFFRGGYVERRRALGVFQSGIAYVLFSKGIKKTPAVSASIITMIEPILNPIWVFPAFGEMPGGLAVAGSLIVLSTVASYNILSSVGRNIK